MYIFQIMSTEILLPKERFVSFAEAPRPPVCEETEWRYLLFLRDSYNKNIPLPVEHITAQTLNNNTQYGISAVRKPKIYGLRTYLTLTPFDEQGLWVAAPGYMLEGNYPQNIIPGNKYLLRPFLSNPDINILHKLSNVFGINSREMAEIEENINDRGFMSLIENYLS